MKIVHVIVRGRVQGVGYRAFVEHEALRHDIEGWARNRRDGTVEAVFAGALENIEAVIEACRKGPFSARVEQIDQRDGADSDLALRRSGELFSLLPTA
ncbi:MAG TPA: acylphosphatase [Pseudolabrys sp.]|jgi:acylphosphatase